MSTTRFRRPRMRQSRFLRLVDRLERQPSAALTSRVKGRHATARVYGCLGLTAVALGGMLGGHLANRQASGANHAEQVPHAVPRGRYRIGAVAEFPADRPVRRSVDDVPILGVRETGGAIHARAEGRSHLAGRSPKARSATGASCAPGRAASSGSRTAGASAAQPACDPRITDGHVEIRPRQQKPGGQAPGEAAVGQRRTETETHEHRS
ncbi:hypothetical protein [Streptomyces griseoluteus]|uniref:hypothetical protein n=1 Tax=Streptomyces griseoluteus TaxID=29306 RepID=UPI0019B0BD87|nr:hypothetical protein GCM10017776_27840 [Streptomyces griseoluteus]